MKTALVIIAMGEVYWKYAQALIDSAKKFLFPHDVFVFTDRVPILNGVKRQIYVPWLGFTVATMMRYHLVLLAKEELSTYDHIFYSDADMLFASPVTEEDLLSNGIVGTEHPGYVDRPDLPEYERNQMSTAYLMRATVYLCGGFNGGTSEAYLKMAETIRTAVNVDFSNRIVARWYDESHLNRYCFDHPPARILSPAFCYPDADDYRQAWARVRGEAYARGVVAKLRALEKTAEELAWRGGPA